MHSIINILFHGLSRKRSSNHATPPNRPSELAATAHVHAQPAQKTEQTIALALLPAELLLQIHSYLSYNEI